MSARRLSGSIDFQQIAEQVRANARKLDSCTRHMFEPLGADRPPFRYACITCGGEVDAHGFYWYEKGLAHGKAEG